ncbi:Oidioi.mRNA.OKI2018_I69.PAR.g12743.t1.cds [Oikopleura dioica]|uniref:Oidioi.mRNA.OKI2018_I69.PAR.g12743.t1.cds n=1 Tax=Oikopleura dioica TaxID=34765 RepID=A0ABN7S7S3_OIKDI|nr:Oidioi.mRNA.OKI2018_I69.PAR.g12743.t1.cds [Oikopleura dioica]
MKLLLNLIFLQLSSVSGNVFGRPRTLAQRAKRLRVNDFVDKYEDVQGPVGVVEVQSEEAEEISEFPEGMLLDVGLISAEKNSETEKKRKVQKPFDWVATKNDN